MSQLPIPGGHTYSDDYTTDRDMNDGGHRIWMMPMIAEFLAHLVTVLDNTASDVSAAAGSADAAADSASAANTDAQAAHNDRLAAEAAAAAAQTFDPANYSRRYSLAPSPTADWVKLGTWTALTADRLLIEMTGGFAYSIDQATRHGGKTTITATILANTDAAQANVAGQYAYLANAACSAVKFVQVGANRFSYDVFVSRAAYANMAYRVLCAGTWAAANTTGLASPGAGGTATIADAKALGAVLTDNAANDFKVVPTYLGTQLAVGTADTTGTANTVAKRTGDGSLVGNHLYAKTSDGSTNGTTIVAIGSNADVLDAYFQMNNSGNTTAPAGARGLALVVNTGAFGIYSGRISPAVQLYMDPTTKQFTFYKSVNPNPVTVTFASTITLDFAASNRFDLTATGNFTLANPSNMKPGQVIVMNVTCSAANIVMSLGSFFKTKGGAGVALSTTSGARDKVVMECVAAGVIDITVQKDWK